VTITRPAIVGRVDAFGITDDKLEIGRDSARGHWVVSISHLLFVISKSLYPFSIIAYAL
jgi:hypothetical protein